MADTNDGGEGLSIFNQLSHGANFERKRFQNDMDIFKTASKKEKGGAKKGTDTGATPLTDATALLSTAHEHGAMGVGTVQVAPAASLDFFGDAVAGDTAAEDEKAAKKRAREKLLEDDAASAPIKPMSKKKVANLHKKLDVKVYGDDLPQPITHFSNLVRAPYNVPRYVTDNLFKREHRTPTAIQAITIPILLKGRDLIACAPTGSGKTVAFLVPLLKLLGEPDRTTGVRALIISPTKELAIQIEREAFHLIGGQRWKFVQHGQSTANKDIFVTTPNRIITMIKQKLIDLANVQYIAFDEGDLLWSENTDFLKDMDTILTTCKRTDKVVSLFSATIPKKVEDLARSVMRDPARVIVQNRTASCKDVEQKLVFVGNEIGKVVAVRNMIQDGIKPPVLIFVQSIERTKELYEEIKTAGLHVAVMNSKMTMEEREATVMQFRLGKIWFLICTDLLARGIDFKGVGTVLNFDFPVTKESYVHRVGRTGRAKQKGLAVTFFTEDDKPRLPAIARMIHSAGYPVDDWILQLKRTERRTQRYLEHTTPHRLAVSTKKRMKLGQQRVRKQVERATQERRAKGIKLDGEEDGFSSDGSMD